MMQFDLAEPRSLKTALKLLDTDDPSVRAIGGGTALMLMMKAGVFQPTRLISLRGVEARYAKVKAAKDGSLHIGALATLSVLGRTAAVKKRAPVIVDTLRTLSNVRVRNVATLGGHLAHADPHMDLPPVLIALDAQVVTAAPSGSRTLAEQGLKGFEVVVWNGIYAPKGTPKPAVDKLVAALQVSVQDAQFKSRIAELGAQAVSKDKATPESLARQLKAEIEKWGPIIKKAGIYAD